MENLITTMKSVSEVLDEFQSGNIAIPEIQRDVVWTADQVKNLIDSMNRGFPCGAFIYWEPREKDHSLVRSMIRPERLELHDGRLPRYFLLDGQQRVTSLASVFLKREKVREILLEMEEEMPFVFANLKRFPKEFEATADPSGYGFPWTLFNKLFDGSYHQDADWSKLDAGTAERVREFVQRLRDYKFPVQIIRDQDYVTVAEIFTRVNSAGTQLTGAEIHLARIVPRWKGITREFRDYRRQLALRNYDLDLTFLMRAVTVVECDVPQIKKLADRIDKDRPSSRYLDRRWRQTREAINKMIRILQNGLSLDKSKFFTSKNTLVPITYSLAKTGGGRRLERDVRRFFVLSQLSEHYGAAAENALRRDFRTLTDPSSTPKRGLSDLAEAVKQEAKQSYRGLRIRPDDVGGRASKNVLVLLMYILMRERGATDWGTGKRPSFEEIEPRELHLHHIFPFNFMNGSKVAQQWYLDNDYSIVDFRNDVNDIANLTFLSQTKNSEIGDQPPWQYLPNETTPDMRKSHFIPEDQKLWKVESFVSFLDERRRLLAEGMNRLLRNL